MPTTTDYTNCTACCTAAISSTCCPTSGVPAVLYITLDDPGGTWTLTVTANYRSASNDWASAGFTFPQCGGNTWSVETKCNGPGPPPTFIFNIYNNSLATGAGCATAFPNGTCSPFLMTASGVVIVNGSNCACPGGVTFNLTISDTHP